MTSDVDDDFELHMNTNCALANDLAGILAIGGSDASDASQSVEFWSAEQGSCVLSDYPREMRDGTVDLVSGRLVACHETWYEQTCEIYKEGSWQHLQNTTERRSAHSSVTTEEEEERVLLIGGKSSNSTEWIPAVEEGSVVQQPGPFAVRHGYSHCTIQLSDGFLVVTGGLNTEPFVTQYHLDGGNDWVLTPLGQPRRSHACGVFRDADDQQVSF